MVHNPCWLLSLYVPDILLKARLALLNLLLGLEKYYHAVVLPPEYDRRVINVTNSRIVMERGPSVRELVNDVVGTGVLAIKRYFNHNLVFWVNNRRGRHAPS